MPNLKEVNRLAAELRAVHRHVVTAAFRATPAGQAATPAILDQFVVSLRLHPLGEDWIELPRGVAERLTADVLEFDPAYRVRVLDAEVAAGLGGRFAAAFGKAGRFFTNSTRFESAHFRGVRAASDGWASTPLTDATFSECVVGHGAGWVGIVCVEGED